MLARRLTLYALPVALLGLLVTVRSAEAQPPFPPINIIDADYGGTGCPDGTASVVIAGNTMTIIFDEYSAETSPGRQTDYKSCNFAVALDVPPGYTVAIIRIDYRGFADIPSPRKARGMFRAEYFWAGAMGPVYTTTFPPGYFGNWVETDHIAGAVWSPCGGEVIARANTSVIARKGSPHSSYEAQVQVDTADIRAGIIYYFMARRC